jgi:ubiquinone/menaquinone biosynthesis C-methylase UbiE
LQGYPIREGIILMEEKGEGTDLRIGNDLLDLYELKKERKYYGSYIQSDVEYTARLHGVNFSNFHTELLSPYLSDSIILDLGCGQLPYVESFPETKVKEFYGVDLSLESLRIARRNFKGAFPLILVRYGVRKIPFRDASVDMVVSSEVLEHLSHPKNYLQEIYRVMKKGGYLSLSTPCASMYLYPHNLLYIVTKPVDWFLKLNGHKYWEKALHWHPGLKPRILRKWVEETGFSIKRHETRLWYYHTPIKLMWRLFFLIEIMGISSAAKIFSKYLKLMDTLLASNIPIIKWFGIRQFILCQKKL